MSDTAQSYPGERLGLPETGPGSVGRLGRRIAAYLGFQQWALPKEAGLSQFAPMIVFAVLQIVFIPTIGGSPGHRIVGMRLVMLHGGWVGLWRPIVRTVLLVFVIPAVIFDADQRGLHDKAVGTVLIRA